MSDKRPSQWWREDDPNRMAESIWSHISFLEERSAGMRERDAVHLAAYNARHHTSGAYAAALAAVQAAAGPLVSLNVTKSCIDTLTARVSKNSPQVKVTAEGGLWSMKRRARRLSRFIGAKLSDIGYRRLAPIIFRDACIRGTGILHVTNQRGEVVVQRVPKAELFVDELEARYGEPRTLHHRKQYAKEELIALFPDHASAIEMGGIDRDRSYDDLDLDYADYDTKSVIDVAISYHLPSGPDADDGCRVVSIKGQVLESVPWERERFPYVFFHFNPPDSGFWGTGLAEELLPIQWTIDRTLQVLDEGFRLGAPMKVFVERGSKIVKTHLNNRVGAIIEFSGRAPEIRAPSNPVSQQQINWLLQNFEWAYQISGISLLSATAQKPSGIESGVALRTLHDFDTVRFADLELRHELVAPDAAECILDEAREIYSQKDKGKDGKERRRFPDFHAKWSRRDVLEKIKWKDVNIGRGQYKLKLQPVNFISGTHVHQIERAKELAEAGLVPAHWLLPLFDSPDLQRFYRLEAAQFNYLEWFVEEIIEEDRRLPTVDSMADFKLVLEHTKAAYFDCLVDGAPPAVLSRFRDVITTIDAKQRAAQPAAPMQPPGGLMADPMAPPQYPGLMPPGAPPPTPEVPPLIHMPNGA